MPDLNSSGCKNRWNVAHCHPRALRQQCLWPVEYRWLYSRPQQGLRCPAQPACAQQGYANPLRFPILRLDQAASCAQGLPSAHPGPASHMASIAADSFGAVRRSSGVSMLQMHRSTHHLNPFTHIVWKRTRRRWLGLRAGEWVPVEETAPWLLGLQQWLIGVQMSLQQGLHHLQHQLQHVLPQLRPRLPEWRPQLPQLQQIPWSRVLLAGAAVLLLMLLVAAVWSAKQQRAQQPAQAPVNPELLARKAASLDQQRSRFRRALGNDEEPLAEAASTSDAMQDIVTDQHRSRGQDNFDAWDNDTQKQWKQFMRGSRSQEIDEEQWWDVNRVELPADRQVYQDFN